MAEEKTTLKKNQKTESKQVQVPQGLYSKCRSCGELLHQRELDQNLKVCPKCGHHYPLTAWERLYLTVDSGTFEEWDEGVTSGDPLQFPQYPERYRRAQEKTGLPEAVVTGRGRIEKIPVALAITDFAFMGGSMGGAVGEKITRAIERAVSKKMGVVILSASGGGARMQEGIFSLMQMAKISAALTKLGEAGLPYISVLTDPTAGGGRRIVRDVGRRELSRTRCHDWFCGTQGNRANHSAEIAQRLPAVGIFARARFRG